MHRISPHLRAPHLLDSDSELVTQYKNKYKNKDKCIYGLTLALSLVMSRNLC